MANAIIHDLKGKRVLVTGAAGMIGHALGNQLRTMGADVYGIDIRGPRSYIDLNISADIWHFINENEIDHVFHLAGMKGGAGIGRSSGFDFLSSNVRPTINLIEALVDNGFKGRLLYTSTVGAYADTNGKPFKEVNALIGEPHPSDYYGGMAKRFGELLCKAAHEQYGLDYVVVRPTNCFGPHDTFNPKTAMVITALIARLEAGENPLKLTGYPETRRDFLYSEDAARGMIAAMQRGRCGEIYNLGTGATLSIKQIARALTGIYGRELVMDESSADVAPAVRVMDMTKSEQELGFEAKFSLDQLKATVEWHRAHI